ncbi:MAG TPA: peptidylprolyl isomerase [Gemmataceae bacterium]|nr:peptidylprolyl isomerase [Gemmataceae bacterium]
MPRRVFVPALLLALTATAAAQTPAPPAPSPIAATINGEPIRLEEVDAYIKGKLAATPLTTAQLRQLRTEVVSDMIDDVLLRQFLRQHGPKIDPAEIDKHLKALAESLANQRKTLADFYRETNQTEAQVRETWTKLLQLSGYVRQHVSDDQLRQYYSANKDYFDRVEVKVSHIMIRVGPGAMPTERAAAKDKLRALRAEIVAGRLDFAEAAKKHSQCPSAPQGGDLGYILRKGMLTDEAFCKAAFAMKPGELSDVVESAYGVHLIRVTDRKPGMPSTFEKCTEDVLDQFTEDFRVELVAKLRKQAQIQITVP